MSYHPKFGPDRFSRFDVNWIQTNTQADKSKVQGVFSKTDIFDLFMFQLKRLDKFAINIFLVKLD